MKHKNKYSFFRVDQDVLDFLRCEGQYLTRRIERSDKQIYSHGIRSSGKDKHIGIIIDVPDGKFFAPVTHDGEGKWLARGPCPEIENMYNERGAYLGSVLLCKALPLSSNLVHFLSIKQIDQEEGTKQADLCARELDYINDPIVHENLQVKMYACYYGRESSNKELRVDYQLATKNIAEYNAMLFEKEVVFKEILIKAIKECAPEKADDILNAASEMAESAKAKK